MMEQSSQRFDKIATNFLTSEVHRSSPSIQRLHQLVPFEDGFAVCDVACGAGHLGLSFAGRAGHIVSVDPSPNMLAACRQLAESREGLAETIEAYAESLPLEAGTFDLTASRLAAHHFADVAQAVREMARVTQRGGLVAVIDLEGDPDPEVDGFNHRLEVLHDPTHVRSYRATQWQALFAEAGLAVEALERRQSERPGGVTVRRWCEIASSGEAAEREIRRLLQEAPPAYLEALGIGRSGDEYLMPVRTLLIVGRKG